MKTLLYCDKAGDALCAPDGKNFMGYFLDRPVLKTYPDATLNGTVCFQCDIEEAEKIEHLVEQIYGGYSSGGDEEYDELLKRSCRTKEQIISYFPKHALYLSNVKAIEPTEIQALCVGAKPERADGGWWATRMRRAPQNMCYAWQYNPELDDWERVLVISVHPGDLCNIGNGLKDIELRNVITKGLRAMEQ